jgi:hypothetical protein
MTFANEGPWDRTIRILAAVALGYVAWVAWPGPLGIVSLVIAVIALFTGIAGWCAAYAALGMSTKKKASA